MCCVCVCGGGMQGCNRSVGVAQAGSKPASIYAQASRVLPCKTNPKPIQFPIQLQRGRRRANRVCTHPPLPALPRGPSVSQENADQQHGSHWDDVLVVTMTPRGWEWLYWLRWVELACGWLWGWKLCLCNGNGCFGS